MLIIYQIYIIVIHDKLHADQFEFVVCEISVEYAFFKCSLIKQATNIMSTNIICNLGTPSTVQPDIRRKTKSLTS